MSANLLSCLVPDAVRQFGSSIMVRTLEVRLRSLASIQSEVCKALRMKSTVLTLSCSMHACWGAVLSDNKATVERDGRVAYGLVMQVILLEGVSRRVSRAQADLSNDRSASVKWVVCGWSFVVSSEVVRVLVEVPIGITLSCGL